MIGILDCNNFYASCERVFRPELAGQPIAVLSNNDGCIIARSQEVKDLGIPMAVPLFKYKQQLKQHNVQLFSANFVLYGDLSQRVMQILKAELPQVEVYSIDEAFFDLSHIPLGQALSVCHLIKRKIQQWLGLPVSIGIGANKTLAKLANNIAKQDKDCNGFYHLANLQDESRLHHQPVRKLWGVGERLASSLQVAGISTIKQLYDMDIAWVRKKYSVIMEQTVRELRGEYCFQLAAEEEYKQHLCVARSFGSKVNSYIGLRAAIVNFTTIACEKLRSQQCWAKSITVFIRTDPFNAKGEQYRASTNVVLAAPSQETQTLIKAAVNGLKSLYKLDYNYKKAGVVINDILPANIAQLDLFDAPEKPSELSSTLDEINNKYCFNRETRAAIQYAAVNSCNDWCMSQNYRTPRYTTNWSEIKQIL